MNTEFNRIIKLVKKTGDRIVVFDSQKPDQSYVIMSIDEYENLMDKRGDVKDLTEGQMLDKINRDIASWKDDQEEIISDNSEITPEENSRHTESPRQNKKGTRARWQIPKERKSTSEDLIDEENTQYLEEVNY